MVQKEVGLMKYPMAKNWLSYRRISQTEYEVIDNLSSTIYTVSSALAKFIRRLDGRTDPYQIDPSLPAKEVREILDELREYELLRESRILEFETGTLLVSLWIPKWNAGLHIAAYLLHRILLVSWLPAMIVGIWIFSSNIQIVQVGVSVCGGICGTIMGICMHEVAHAAAGISYRHAKVFEFGIGFENFLPCAYTMMECSDCKKMERVQINAAGAEMNFWLMGVLLMLCAAFPSAGSLLFTASVYNGILGAANLLCLNGFDGFSILSELIGIEGAEFLTSAKKIVASRRQRRLLRGSGFHGYAVIMLSYIISFSQVGYPLLIIANIWGIFLCFA